MKKEKEWMPQNKGLREKLYVVIVILLVIVLLISVWQLGRYLIDGWKSRTFSEDLQEFVIFDDERELKNEVTDQKQEEEPAEQEQAIPAFIDFDNLYEMGENAVAWLYCPDTEINYVIAQADNNDYYLHRLLNGTEASGGTLFMDYRNSDDLSDWNTVIYGHNMKNGTMFAMLLDYQNPAYYEEHPAMYLYTPEHRYRLDMIAGYSTSVNDLVYSVPASKEDRDAIISHACKVSSFISNVTVADGDKLVTLSTCAYGDTRYVVVGKLVEEK